MRIRLTRKLAESVNGVDLSAMKAGQELELPEAAANMLIAERWAERVTEPSRANDIKRPQRRTAAPPQR